MTDIRLFRRSLAQLSAVFVCLTLTQVTYAAKNVILMIGDGMGFNHVAAGSYYLTGQQGQLCFEPYYKASVTTTPLGGGITDSAAAATALATGNKVANGTISQSARGGVYQTILEKAKAMGKYTGLVTTAPTTDATPAAFGAHEASRSNISQIGDDFFRDSMPNLIMGGGTSNFSAAQLATAQQKGYQLFTDANGMNALSSSANYALGTLSGGDMTYEYDRFPTSTQPHLSQMTSKALSLAAQDNDGFFLMIEGGIIDHAAHSNDINRATKEVVEFNNSVQTVLNWLQGRTDTMLIVTADHETGGLSITPGAAGSYVGATWSTGGHSGVNVPFYITGANANLADAYVNNGVIDNTDVFKIMSDAYAVPEPSGLAAGVTGLVCLLGTRRYKHSRG